MGTPIHNIRYTKPTRAVGGFVGLFILMLVVPITGRAGISLAGTSGLINIPTAQVISDQQVVIGLGYVDRHAAYLATSHFHNYPLCIVLGYLPRLEFSAGVTIVPGQQSYDGTNTYKDGIISLQYLVMDERGRMPAIAIGARDIYSFILLNTTFLVVSKTIVDRPRSQWRLHIGYGSDLIKRHLGVPKKDRDLPVGHTIIGLFWGLEISWKNRFIYVLEYDTQKINAGVRLLLSQHLNLMLVRMDMEHWSGSLNWMFRL